MTLSTASTSHCLIAELAQNASAQCPFMHALMHAEKRSTLQALCAKAVAQGNRDALERLPTSTQAILLDELDDLHLLHRCAGLFDQHIVNAHFAGRIHHALAQSGTASAAHSITAYQNEYGPNGWKKTFVRIVTCELKAHTSVDVMLKCAQNCDKENGLKPLEIRIRKLNSNVCALEKIKDIEAHFFLGVCLVEALPLNWYLWPSLFYLLSSPADAVPGLFAFGGWTAFSIGSITLQQRYEQWQRQNLEEKAETLARLHDELYESARARFTAIKERYLHNAACCNLS